MHNPTVSAISDPKSKAKSVALSEEVKSGQIPVEIRDALPATSGLTDNSLKMPQPGVRISTMKIGNCSCGYFSSMCQSWLS